MKTFLSIPAMAVLLACSSAFANTTYLGFSSSFTASDFQNLYTLGTSNGPDSIFNTSVSTQCNPAYFQLDVTPKNGTEQSLLDGYVAAGKLIVTETTVRNPDGTVTVTSLGTRPSDFFGYVVNRSTP